MSCRTRAIRSIAEIESIRHSWVERQLHPNSDLDHFIAICSLRTEEVLRPHIIVVEDDTGAVLALVAAREERVDVTPSFGYFRAPPIKANVLNLIHEGIIGKLDSGSADSILQHVRSFLATGECDMAFFSQVPEGDLLLTHAFRTVPWICRDGLPVWNLHWQRTLPSGQGFLLEEMRSKHRAWIRKKMRALESDFAEGVIYRKYCEFDRIPEACVEMEKVAKVTYQRGLGAGFSDDVEHRERYKLFAKRGLFRCWVLYLNGVPEAFWVGILYKTTFHSEATGYDPQLSHYELGTQMFLHMADDLVSEGVQRIDFGLGDAPYKSRFGDHSYREGSFRLYGPRLKPLAVRCVNGLTQSIGMGARRLLSTLGFMGRVKTFWRQRIAGRQREARS